jgi:hypothetical protein
VDYIVIEGVQPYDGRYELDLSGELTTREWGWIKRLAGYLPLGLEDDSFSDPELACVLAVIMMRRSGRIQTQEVPGVFERLADAPFGAAITIEADETAPEETDDASPPPSSSNGSSAASGPSSATSSETWEPTPPATGTPASGSSPSDQATLAS